MYHIDFHKPIRIHFIGIGGISMSGFAELLHTFGFQISGSDRNESKITKRLKNLGISIIYDQTASNITPDIDLVVYTAAVHEDNEEFAAAKAAGSKWLVVEQDQPSMGLTPIECAKASMEYLKSIK